MFKLLSALLFLLPYTWAVCSDLPVEKDQSEHTAVHLSLPGKNYYLGIYFKANFFTASEFCRYHGMRLATVQSQEENDKLVTYMNLMGVGTEHVWLSGSDLGHEGTYVWMSTGQPLTFANFLMRQPNNRDGTEHCVEILNGGKWNDTACDDENFFVCEF